MSVVGYSYDTQRLAVSLQQLSFLLTFTIWTCQNV